MQRTFSIAIVLTFTLISFTSISQDLAGILVKENLKVEFVKGHSCMTQTRAETKEEALYNVSSCGAVRYKLSNKGSVFKIFQKDEKNNWYEWARYEIAHSFQDQINGDERYTLLTTDGSSIFYIPDTGAGPLVVLDLRTEEVLHYIYE